MFELHCFIFPHVGVLIATTDNLEDTASPQSCCNRIKGSFPLSAHRTPGCTYHTVRPLPVRCQEAKRFIAAIRHPAGQFLATLFRRPWRETIADPCDASCLTDLIKCPTYLGSRQQLKKLAPTKNVYKIQKRRLRREIA